MAMERYRRPTAGAPTSLRIGVLGAGAIGCFVGGRLAAAGSDVVLVGRMADEIAAHGLTLTDFAGGRVALPPERVSYHAAPAALADRDVVLVATKTGATEAAAQDLAATLPVGRTVVSFQNGVRSAEVLRSALSAHRVLAAMVPFNVLRQPGGTFHLGTSGTLMIESSDGLESALLGALRGAGFDVAAPRDIVEVQWGKLLMNLGNAVNALSGVPIREQISDRGYRRIMAASMAEALAAMRAARIRPAAVTGVPPRLVPVALRLPDVLFQRIARASLTVDPHARSSMWQDLERRRSTEVDDLNGEVVRLAQRTRTAAPVNAALVALVHEAEAAGQGSPRLSAAALASRLG